MEIIIVGVLFVALMVFVSTKIKRAAARAYESELVETNEFRIEKPAGFVYPINAETEFPFEAYSRQFGDRDTRNIWRARIRLRRSEGLNVRKIVDSAKSSGEEIISEKILDDLPEGQIGSILRSEKEEDEVGYKVLRKVVADKSAQKTYELKTTILAPFAEDYTDEICEMMRSFELKAATSDD